MKKKKKKKRVSFVYMLHMHSPRISLPVYIHGRCPGIWVGTYLPYLDIYTNSPGTEKSMVVTIHHRSRACTHTPGWIVTGPHNPASLLGTAAVHGEASPRTPSRPFVRISVKLFWWNVMPRIHVCCTGLVSSSIYLVIIFFTTRSEVFRHDELSSRKADRLSPYLVCVSCPKPPRTRRSNQNKVPHAKP